MRRAQFLGAAALVSPVILVVAGAVIRGAHPDVPRSLSLQRSTAEVDFEPPVTTRKADRLPMPAAEPALNAQVASPPQQIQAATEDDIRQAEEEHHRHREICPRGKT